MGRTPTTLVTGGTRGIGKAIVTELADAGFDVAFTGRTLREGEGTEELAGGEIGALPGSLETTAAEVERRGRRALAVRLDLLDRASVLAGTERVLKEWGVVDVLVVGDENGFDFVPTVDAALSSVFRAVDRGRAPRMILPNPDLIFPHSEDSFGIAAGSVAAIIESALQRRYPERHDLDFDRLGKPGTALYEAAMSRTGSRNVVMIGDQLETDIAGARSAGIHSVLISTGIALQESSERAAENRPNYWMRSLAD